MPIDHSRIIDGFAELAHTRFYRDRDADCGVCGSTFRLSAAAQKVILEITGAPVKSLDLGSAFCNPCLARRKRIKALQRKKLHLEQLADGKNPDTTEASLLLRAEAKLALFERFRVGRVERVIALARAATRAMPASLDALRVLLRAQVLAGHERTAHSALAQFRSTNRLPDIHPIDLSESLRPVASEPAMELEALLKEEEQVRRNRRNRGCRTNRETLYPADFDMPVRCPSCTSASKHPFTILPDTLLCPHCEATYPVPRRPPSKFGPGEGI